MSRPSAPPPSARPRRSTLPRTEGTDGTAGGPAPRPGVGASQLEVLQALKRRGPSTIVELGAALRLAKETLREHLEALVFRGLVTRAGSRRGRPGRPEIVYALAPAAEGLFPRRESAVLVDLVRHLLAEGREEELRAFFAARAAERREAARARLEGLRGRRRVEEVARILTEEGYMAEAETDAAGRPRTLRLCHCPIREVVDVTPLPCGAELGFVRELLGKERPLVRVAYLPDGDASCSYRLDRRAARPHPSARRGKPAR